VVTRIHGVREHMRTNRFHVPDSIAVVLMCLSLAWIYRLVSCDASSRGTRLKLDTQASRRTTAAAAAAAAAAEKRWKRNGDAAQ